MAITLIKDQRKRDSRRHSTRSLSENVVEAGTSFMKEITRKINDLGFGLKKIEHLFTIVLLQP